MIVLLLISALHFSPVASQKPDVFELRKALDTLREGNPGEPAFDEAVQYLPNLIESGSGWFVAGGAYLAGRHGRRECIPALLAALEHENTRPEEVVDYAKLPVLDALIRLEARVPQVRLTERLDESSLVETYLLLEGERELAGDALIALFDAAAVDERARWAAGCALVDTRHGRIAERLLAGMEWELEVAVRDPGSEAIGSFGGGGSHWSSAHECWPPRVTYELVLPEVQETPLSPIPYLRTENSRSGRLPDPVRSVQRNQLKARLLDELLGEVEERGLLRPSEDLDIEWTDAEAYVQALREHCLGLRDRIARVAVRLEAAGLVGNAEEVSAAAKLRVRIGKFHRELPAPPDLTGVIFEQK